MNLQQQVFCTKSILVPLTAIDWQSSKIPDGTAGLRSMFHFLQIQP